MEALHDLQKRIESIEDLRSVVKTMKALAAVNIRQYEKAAVSLQAYGETVELGLRIALRGRKRAGVVAKSAPRTGLGAIIFGSDQGMCGPLNERLVSHAMKTIAGEGVPLEKQATLVIGERAAGLLEAMEWEVGEYFPVPGSVAAIVPQVQELLLRIQGWNASRNISHVLLFYSKPLPGGSFRPHTVRLLPVDQDWLARLEQRRWPTGVLPTFNMDWAQLLSALIREYLFVSLFQAFTDSLASENASRLAAMQGAERNIEERLGELSSLYHRQRQMSITEELLDIVAGFEALQRSR